MVFTEYLPGPVVKPPSAITAAAAAARVTPGVVVLNSALQDPAPQETDGTVPPVPERVVLRKFTGVRGSQL